MEALDTLASEALSNGNGNGNGQELEPMGELEAEEAAGGPPMPAVGVEGAAIKASLVQDVDATTAGQASIMGGGGVGDAAMAAVDDRLDTGELPHTNGYINQRDEHNHNGQVDYARVAKLTGNQEENERVPPLSNDIDQPLRQGELQGEPEQPAPGVDTSVSLDQIDLPASIQPPSLPSPTSISPPRPPAELSQTLPQPLDSHSNPAEQEKVLTSHLPSSSFSSSSSPSRQLDPLVPPSSSSLATITSLPGGDLEPIQPSMDSLPEDPTPLPSQLVSSTVSQTDLSQEGPSSAIPIIEQALPFTRSPYEPTIPTNSISIPPSHPDSIAPPSISPTLAKRPFEPDNSSQSIPYQGNQMEPIVKRQKVSPDTEDHFANQAAIDAAGIPRDLLQENTDASMMDNSTMDQSLIDQSLDNHRVDGEASPAVSTFVFLFFADLSDFS